MLFPPTLKLYVLRLCTANELRHCFITTLPFPLLAQLSIILYDFLAIYVFLELLHPLLSHLAVIVFIFSF